MEILDEMPWTLLPQVLVEDEGKRIRRNAAAQKQLPALRPLKHFLKEKHPLFSTVLQFSAELENERYDISVHPVVKEGICCYRLTFFRDDLYLREPFFSYLLKEDLSVTSAVFDKTRRKEDGTGLQEVSRRLEARTNRHREEVKLYLHLMNQRKQRTEKERSSCNLSAFFRWIANGLGEGRLKITALGNQNDAVLVDPEELCLAVLNVLQTVYLLEGGTWVTVRWSRKGEKEKLCFSFSDEEGFLERYRQMLSRSLSEDDLSRALTTLPVLCAFAVGRENGYEGVLRSVIDHCVEMELTLPAAPLGSASFLEAEKDRLEETVLRLIKENFSFGFDQGETGQK